MCHTRLCGTSSKRHFQSPRRSDPPSRGVRRRHDTTINSLVRDLLQETVIRQRGARAAADRLLALADQGPTSQVIPARSGARNNEVPISVESSASGIRRALRWRQTPDHPEGHRRSACAGPIGGIRQPRAPRGQSHRQSAPATGGTSGTGAILQALLRVRPGIPLRKLHLPRPRQKTLYGTVIPAFFQQFVFGRAHRSPMVLGNHDMFYQIRIGSWLRRIAAIPRPDGYATVRHNAVCYMRSCSSVFRKQFFGVRRFGSY
jgi:hypothetical protein